MKYTDDPIIILNSLLSLKDGTIPCTPKMVDKALDIINLGNNFKLKCLISKGSSPHLELAFQRETHSLIFTVNPDLTVDFIYEVNTGGSGAYTEKEVLPNMSFRIIQQKMWELANLVNFSEIKECPFCKSYARIFPKELITAIK
jgi:hypothetical protein